MQTTEIHFSEVLILSGPNLPVWWFFLSAPCDIIGDVSYEELRLSAYNDAKSGMSILSIVSVALSIFKYAIDFIGSLLTLFFVVTVKITSTILDITLNCDTWLSAYVSVFDLWNNWVFYVLLGENVLRISLKANQLHFGCPIW